MNQANNDNITMTYSSLLQKDGKKAICVRFERVQDGALSDEPNYAEALLPDYRITRQSGFTKEEIIQLEYYLKTNKDQILKESTKISNIMHWF